MPYRSPPSGRALAGGLALWLASGCIASPTDPSTEAARADEQTIKGGYADPDDSAVVLVYDALQGDLGGICSGSLIAPNVVLTAHHCVADVTHLSVSGTVLCPRTDFGPPHGADALFVSTRQTPGSDPSDYHLVREVVVPPADTKLCGGDLAILILKDDIDPSEAVPLAPRVDSELAPGEQYHAVGFGRTSDGGAGTGTRRRRDALFVDCVEHGCPSVDAHANEWSGDHGICQGDSGGPALDELNRVTGVASRAWGGCESPIYGYVFGWAQWIKDSTAYAAGLGGYAAPGWTGGWPTDPAYSMPVGDACTEPADCASNACVNDGKVSYCTRLCNEVAPCPEGYACDSTGLCMQVHATTNNGNDAVAEDDTTLACSTHVPGGDPMKHAPWLAAVGALASTSLLRRRLGR